MVTERNGRRRQHDASERRAVLERLATSGVGMAAFCRAESISVGTLRRWKDALGAHAGDQAVFVDPDFEAEAADVIGLCLNPPAHAAVFCVDEKTAIQALDRKDRMLQLSPGRAQSHGFE